MVPVRAFVAPFVETPNETVPFPDPFAPAVTVSQLLPLTAVHEQPVAAVTATVPLPADEAND